MTPVAPHRPPVIATVIPILDPDDSSTGQDIPVSEGTSRCFSLEQAASMLPLVGPIAIELGKLSMSIDAQRDQVRTLEKLQRRTEPDEEEASVYRDERDDVLDSLRAENGRQAALIGELEALGLVVHHPVDGSVDFPGRLGGREIYWCWRPGDATLNQWHERNQTPDQRRPLACVN